LTNEGFARAPGANRVWDIGVGDDAAGALGNLVVDNITSEGDGDTGTWTAGNSFGYEGTFTASGTGTLTALMQRQIGGDPQDPNDNNPILQAVIVNAAIPEPSTLVLAALGLLTLAGSRFRRRR
jgi:hypothetical protein